MGGVPARASAIAHDGLDLCNPLPASLLDAAVAALGPLGRVLDVGCGKGDLLARLVRAGAVSPVGVDLSPSFTVLAQSRLGSSAEVVTTSFAEWSPGPAYDVVCCVGASHALAPSVWAALPVLRSLVRDGGRVLLGEGYWRRPPDPAYLAALGASADDYAPLEGLRARLASVGLVVSWEAVASEADWTAYESAWAGNLRAYAAAHPSDPEAASLRALADAGWERFDRLGGRECLGFALLVCGVGGDERA